LWELWSYLRYFTSRVLQTLPVTGRQAPWRSTVPELEQTFVFVGYDANTVSRGPCELTRKHEKTNVVDAGDED